MNYSSALVRRRPRRSRWPTRSTPRCARALRELRRARPATALLEIGCGWGALRRSGGATSSAPRVTGVTLSTEQLDYAQRAPGDAGPGRRAPTCGCRTTATSPTAVRRHRLDRDVRGRRARATGRATFATVQRPAQARRRAPASRPSPSATTCSSATARSTDFIQQYIFPGGMLPSRAAFRAEARSAGLRGGRRAAPSAPTTPRRCAAGATRFLAQRRARCARSGFDTRFMRIWEFYLAYCEAAFATGNTDVVQFTLQRADAGMRHRAAARLLAWPRAAAAARRPLPARAGAPPRSPPSCRGARCRAAAGCASSACTSTTPGCGSADAGCASTGPRAARAGAALRPRASTARPIAERSLERDAAPAARIDAEHGCALAGGDDARCSPTCETGDRITGVQRAGRAARFFVNGRLRGEVRRRRVRARASSASGSTPRTSQPGLRERCSARQAADEPRRMATAAVAALARRLARRPALRRARACRWPSSRCRCTCMLPNHYASAVRRAAGAAGRAAAGRAPARRRRRPAGSAAGSTAGSRTRARGCWLRRRGGRAAGAGLPRRCSSRRARRRRRCWPGARALLARDLPRLQRAGGACTRPGARACGGDAAQRARIVAWREGLALAGRAGGQRAAVALAGLPATQRCVFAARCWPSALALLAARAAAGAAPARAGAAADGARRWPTPAFRRLLAIFLVNGIASAVPATLVLFFIRDRAAGAGLRAAVPGQLLRRRRAVDAAVGARWCARFGLARAWLAGMALADRRLRLGARCWARATSPAFAAGLRAPAASRSAPTSRCRGALLAGVIQRAGHGRPAEGAYFGWWNFATKLNLALAAGLALPLLGAVRLRARQPRRRGAARADASPTALLPCVLKLARRGAAAGALAPDRHEEDTRMKRRLLLAAAPSPRPADRLRRRRRRPTTRAETPVLDLRDLLQRRPRSPTASSPTAPARCVRRFTVQMTGTLERRRGRARRATSPTATARPSAASGA
ncbi:MAG: class I SAM-dependent methyltransferase [Comamonadaceae bacterium]|nr:class I SAM-dependent methyltransferase [Comamonadaceae bacterium]